MHLRTDRPTDRSREISTTIGRYATRATRPKTDHQFNTSVTESSYFVTHRKQQKHKRCYYFAAHCRNVTVLRSNNIFCVFAVSMCDKITRLLH